MHRVVPARVEVGARHPRERLDWPLVGIFAQRGKARPNRIGLTRAAIQKSRAACSLSAASTPSTARRSRYQALDGEFAPIGETRQPPWATELMADYYKD